MSSPSHRKPVLRGLLHSPEQDIQDIRTLLGGYGSEESLLKELLQNAEDAGATRLDVLFVPGDDASPVPLLRTPGFCVVNDGAFAPEHLEAMFRLGLGTKGTDARAIGRFGKGLKSVFSICEAFFIAARIERSAGWDNDSICHFCNPWTGWRHEDWDAAFDAHQVATYEHIAKAATGSGQAFGERWLALLIPLRHPSHGGSDDSMNDWIYQQRSELLPGEAPGAIRALADELTRLAPSLPLLRNVEHITLLDTTSSTPVVASWSIDSGSTRRATADEGRTHSTEPLTGSMSLTHGDSGRSGVAYTGLYGTLARDRVTSARQRNDWPAIVDIRSDGSRSSTQAKGEPQFATFVSVRDAQRGHLDVRWCVFFPVAEYPDLNTRVPLSTLSKEVTLGLHGFFFLDSERRRIDGLDADFQADHACIAWNAIVAREGAIAHIPKVLNAFATDYCLNVSQCEELARALRTTWLWGVFSSSVCSADTWYPAWRDRCTKWMLAPATHPRYGIPFLAEGSTVPDFLPGLLELAGALNLGFFDRPDAALVTRGLEPLPEAAVLTLLRNATLSGDESEDACGWVRRLAEDLHARGHLARSARTVLNELPLLVACEFSSERLVRLTPAQWSQGVAELQLFRGPAKDHMLAKVAEAVPSCRPWLSHEPPPTWTDVQDAGPLDYLAAAMIVSSAESLGSSEARHRLALELLPHLDDTAVRSAVRYLIHASSRHASDGSSLLFIADADPSSVWRRLVGSLLALDGDNTWRMVEGRWAQQLTPAQRERLGVRLLDASSCLVELKRHGADVGSVDFGPQDWSDHEVAQVLEDLHNAGRDDLAGTEDLLRRLRVHQLKGAAGRVAIADRTGGLDSSFVLDGPDFSSQLPSDLEAQWRPFLHQAKVVERLEEGIAASIQERLFTVADVETGASRVARVSWPYVIKQCLHQATPATYAGLILHGLSRGSQAAAGIGAEVKNTRWLPTSCGEHIAPASVAQVPGLEDDIAQVLDPRADGLAGVGALEGWIRSHSGFKTLQGFFLDPETSLRMLGMVLAEKPTWHVGLTAPLNGHALEQFLQDMAAQAETVLPGVGLATRLLATPAADTRYDIPSLARTYVMPELFRAFPDQPSERVASLLSSLQGRGRVAFDAYLGQAVVLGSHRGILETILLVDGAGQWRPARLLAWPSESLSPSDQVCEQHAEILGQAGYGGGTPHTSDPTAVGGGASATNADLEANPAVVENYIRPFRQGAIGPNLAAALVAVLGGHPGILTLLDRLLAEGVRQTRRDFLTVLFQLPERQREELTQAIEASRMIVEVVDSRGVTVQTVTGNTITVDLSTEVNTLVVNSKADLFAPRRLSDATDVRYHRVRLRRLQHPDTLADRVEVFTKTIETILLQVHCEGVVAKCPRIRRTVGAVADSGQVELRRSQLYLLDMAEARLKELGIRKSSALDSIVRKYDAARQARVDAELLAPSSADDATQRTKLGREAALAARSELEHLLQSADHSAAREVLIEAVRAKMRSLQYELGSIVRELFQNADDAVAELAEMQTSLEPGQQRFVLRFSSSKKVLDIVHWGRPINQHSIPGFSAGLQRGYGEDLQKMLTLNFSEKASQASGTLRNATGQFGLGFKSVFFASDEPEVISGRLAFRVRAGFYPAAMTSADTQPLRAAARSAGADLPATLIRLPLSLSCSEGEIAEVVASFKLVAPFLTVFAREIRCISVATDEGVSAWEVEHSDLTPLVSVARSGDSRFLCFRCPVSTDRHPATILFAVSASGVAPLPVGMAGPWITLPTAETSDLQYAVNAAFVPDAGRQRIGLTHEANQHLGLQIADAWGTALVGFFEYSGRDWIRAAEALGLHSDVTRARLLHQLWSCTTVQEPRSDWAEIRNGGDIPGWLAWGAPGGAMRRLITECEAIPSGLPGVYERLMVLSSVQFHVQGLLADVSNGLFAHVATWASVVAAFPPGTVVTREVAAFIGKVVAQHTPVRIHLREVLSREVGPTMRAGPAAAGRIGRLLASHGQTLDARGAFSSEIDDIERWMNGLLMANMEGGYRPSKEMVAPRVFANLIEPDEARRASFAPRSAVLSQDYSEEALHLFVRARGKLSAGAQQLAQWARSADVAAMPDVFAYICEGNLGQELADQLGFDWFNEQVDSHAFEAVGQPNRDELMRKFNRGRAWPTPPPPAGVAPPEPQVPPKEALQLVAEWWAREGDALSKDYDKRTYPNGFLGSLPWPGEDGWDAAGPVSAGSRWLLLFIHAALVPLGFNKIGRDSSFSRFLVDKGWLGTFERISSDPEALLWALDDYLDGTVESIPFHVHMRQMVAFYAIAKNLEALLHSLRETDRSRTPGAFASAFSPAANPALTGTGLTAPPLDGILGIGGCYLLRELYRRGRLTSAHGHRYAFTPIRKVRSLCATLFNGSRDFPPGAESSQKIFVAIKTLASPLNIDPTFGYAFDVPFQFLAEDDDLRARVLRRKLKLAEQDGSEDAPI